MNQEGRQLLRGRWTNLRALSPQDIEYFYHVEMAEPLFTRYRHRGITVAPSDHFASLFNGVLVSFAICKLGDAKPIGSFAAYGADHRSQHCRAAVVLFEAKLQGWALEGLALGVDYVFETYPMRKLYFDVMEFNSPQFASVTRRYCVKEARFEEHEYLEGKWWAMETYALYREQWNRRRSRVFRAKQ